MAGTAVGLVSTTVVLSWAEVSLGSWIGVRRRITAMARARSEPAGTARDVWSIDVEGACAEMAVARHMGSYWHALADAVSTLPGDCGALQIRHTARPDGRLIIRPNDNPEAVYVLVTGCAPRFTIVGSLKGSDARRAEWWEAPNDRPGCWFAPQSALSPLGGGQ
jgi:hypothetical protein